MSNSNPNSNPNLNLDIPQPPIPPYIKRDWRWLLGLGILSVFFGFLGLGMVVSLTLVSMFFVGALVLIAGVLQLLDVFKSKDWKSAIWHLLIAMLYIIAGCLIIYDPILASTLITAMLAWILIMVGTARTFIAFSLKKSNGWFWLLLAGLASFMLGVMILMQWPLSGLWVIGLFIAIELIVNGWSYILLAFASKA